MTADPPVEVGAVHVAVKELAPGVRVRPRGTLGGPSGVLDVLTLGPEPAALVATTDTV